MLSREKDHVALCINSFSTAPEGVVAPLVDVGRGTPQDFAGKDLKGAVVLGDANPGQLWSRAVTAGGAIGVISASGPPGYLSPDPPGAPATPREQWDIFQWTSVPYDAAHKAFGFKASARTAATLRRRMASAGSTPVTVRVTVASSFSTGPARTLVAQIPGRSAAAERIVLAAHVQEPGANDNASGVATLAEVIVSLSTAIKSKAISPPERTLTFLFLNEISGSRRWIQDHPAEAKQARYMFSLDMTGEDVKKTGGSFLIERYPDPGAVWPRPWDPHSEWGASNVRADSLKGDLINDEHLFVVQQVAKRTGWIVKTNPYEGGSDHTVFQGAGVPSVLNWHFTDRYYHSNLDTPDKTSPEEMRNVGVAVGASAWLLASATPAMAADVAEIVAAAGRERVATEIREGGKLAEAAADPAAARTRETTIVAAWKKWYAEAVRSASRLVVGTPPASFAAGLEKLASAFDGGATAGFGSARIGPIATAWMGLGLMPPIAPAVGQTPQNKPDPTAIFLCGEDQRVPPIVVTWTTMVLVGDGRFYVPCPGSVRDPPHPNEHRENRERSALNLGHTSFNPEVRWRAAQAMARNPQISSVVKGVTTATNAGPVPTDATMVAYSSVGFVSDTLGMLIGRPLPPQFVPVCNAEAQYFGSSEQMRRWQPGPLFQFLIDDSTEIRKEAAYAIGSRLSKSGLDPDLVTAATKELQACWLKQSDAAVQGLMLEAIGMTRYPIPTQREDAEAFLVAESQGAPLKVLGAVRGLEAMVRQNTQAGLSDATRVRLRQLVSYGKRMTDPPLLDPDARIRRLSLSALLTARDSDIATLRMALIDDDWQVRRLAAPRLNLSDESQAELAQQLSIDPAFQVRYELLTPLSRLATVTRICDSIVARFKDPSPIVAMRAMDVLPPACANPDAAAAALAEWADRLAKPEEISRWHLPSRALTALARVKPEEARSRMSSALKHPVWQVRAAAGAAAVSLGDQDAALVLAADSEPNVRTAGLDALSRMKSAATVPQAIEILKSGMDYQLLRTAALVLKGLPSGAKDDATTALLGALRRLTEQDTDTSRDPRVAILERLAETMRPERSSDLLSYTSDYDDAVVDAAAKAFETLVGTPPAEQPKRRRYPLQPTAEALSHLPSEAVIQLESGSVTLRLLLDVAPVTVARFVELAAQGFYKDRTFHRIVPNFVVQGGSPGANEYVGATRYMRDEVGPQGVNVRGAVGISSRGGDTGDGQIFIDLVDLPRLDRDYTVFAYVTQGMELVDRLLEGAKILNVTVK